LEDGIPAASVKAEESTPRAHGDGSIEMKSIYGQKEIHASIAAR
jgi:hypothetical protein